MKAVSITGPRRAELIEVPDPVAKANYALVKVHVTPMCTEFKLYRDGVKTAQLGHEAAGEVVAIAQPGKVAVGDRVVVMPQYACGKCRLCLQGDYIHCRQQIDWRRDTGCSSGGATYAQYLVKPDWLLLPIPVGVSYELASMACCGLGPTFGAMQRIGVDAFDTVLITGLGPVGLGGVVNAIYRGARVIAVEGHPYRARLARELGAVAVIDPDDAHALDRVLELTDGSGADKAIDCSGAAAAQRFLIAAVRRRGDVAFVGEGGEVCVHVSDDLLRKGLTLHGCWHYNLTEAERLMQVIVQAPELVGKQITHTFPLSRVREAWELQLTGNCGKVLLYPWQ
jgi:L-iditol 2-dehydrogenase